MKYPIIDFIPFLIVLLALLLCLFLSWRSYRKITNKMKAEAKKSRIFKELLELDCRYVELVEKNSLKKFPSIQKSLGEIPYILDRVGYNMNLNNITIVPVKDEEGRRFVKKLLKERARAPRDVKDILDKKTELINEMALLQHPVLYHVLKHKTKLMYNFVYSILLVWIAVSNLIIAFNRVIHKTEKRDGSEGIISDPSYMAMRLSNA